MRRTGVAALRARFEAACRAFLVAHPSGSYQLNRLSAPFPEWLATAPEAEGPHRDFAADVARVERAMEDVFDDPAVGGGAPGGPRADPGWWSWGY